VSAEIVHHDHLSGAEGGREEPFDEGLENATLVVGPTTATHGPMPSVVMLASSVVFLPRLRGTEQSARSPLGAQA
jgi:hypothetical protein